MAIWAIADLHLSFGVPNKAMDIFGERWFNHAARVKANWEATVGADDLVLIPGDISWAKRLDEARPDMEWLEALPGTKVMIRGNHDYWWDSLTKLRAFLPPNVHAIYNTTFHWNDVAVAGGRLWDTDEYSLDIDVPYLPSPKAETPTSTLDLERQEQIYALELTRLETSLKGMKSNARLKLVMTHYPPVGPKLVPSRASRLMARYKVDTCVFGHVHNVAPDGLPYGVLDGVRFVFTACDYLNCRPIKLYD